MATLAELAQEYTDLEHPVVEHLQRLVAGWGVLSDLCFADLLLFAPTRGRHDEFVVLGQVRPTTSQTLHLEDLVGQVFGARGPSAAGPGLAAGQRGGGRGGHPEAGRARPAGVPPGALAGPPGGLADPGVGALGRPAARASSSGSTSRCSTGWPA